jgi:hypothetical protein
MMRSRSRPSIAACMAATATLALTCSSRAQAPASPAATPMTLETFRPVPFEAMNSNEPDKLATPRLMAAAVVAQFEHEPHHIADVSAFQGEFIEAFMVRFPHLHALWTDGSERPEAYARKRLARFGDRVTYKVACKDGDIGDGCVPADTDVILSSWVTMHQPLPGIARFYAQVHAQLPAGGWLIVLDHVGFAPGSPWEAPLKDAQKEFHSSHEGPPSFINTPVPTLEQELAAFKVGGFEDVQVVWRSFTDALFIARKP